MGISRRGRFPVVVGIGAVLYHRIEPGLLVLIFQPNLIFLTGFIQALTYHLRIVPVFSKCFLLGYQLGKCGIFKLWVHFQLIILKCEFK
jgi:hypothetical protein